MINELQNSTYMLGERLLVMSTNLIPMIMQILMAALLLVLGFVFGGILGRSVKHLISVLKVDDALNKIGMAELSKRSGIKLSVASLFGGLIKWIIVISFALFAADMLNLPQVTQFLQSIFTYLPQIIVATIIIIVSALLADFVGKVIDHSSAAAGVRSMLAVSVARYSIIGFGIMAALVQLGIAVSLLQILFTGLVLAFSLSVGLAFGLGGKDVAAKILNDFFGNKE